MATDPGDQDGQLVEADVSPVRRILLERLALRDRLARLEDDLIEVRIETVERKLEQLLMGDLTTRPALPVDAIDQALGRIADRLRSIEDGLLDGRRPGRPSGIENVDDGPDWGQVVLGGGLADDPATEEDRQRLLADLRVGNLAALGLVGHLLVFRTAPDAQRPQMLKDLGEAYYRWHPKGPDVDRPMEVALATWLEQSCEAIGIRRKIELVRPGARFNVAYHKAVEKGIEIAEVFGWVILREDGSVYQKANVSVR